MQIKHSVKSSIIHRSLMTLEKNQRKKISQIVVAQIILGSLDLIGVALVGVLGALSVSGVQSRQPGGRVYAFLNYLHIAEFSFQSQVAMIGIMAVTILIFRTVITMYFNKKLLHFLSKRAADYTEKLLKRLLKSKNYDLKKRSVQESIFAITTGVSAINLGVLAQSSMLISDFSLLLIIFTGLLFLEPLTALTVMVCLSVISYVTFRKLHKGAKDLGSRNSKLEIQSSEKFVEVYETYREAIVRGRRDYYIHSISALRNDLADTLAKMSFMPSISKYVIEIAIIIGTFSIAAFQFIVVDANHAVATLSVFFAAGARIAPALMRIQQNLLFLKSNAGIAEVTLRLDAEFDSIQLGSEADQTHAQGSLEFLPKIEIENLKFKYPGSKINNLTIKKLAIQPGQSLGIVGPSGAGKSTLIDLLMGVLEPDQGSITISGQRPEIAIQNWPGAVAYVPQQIAIVDGTIESNIGIGFDPADFDLERMWECLRIAQLSDHVRSLPGELKFRVGTNGGNLSGGQRQRLGIARALYTKPKLLILDEATSALDIETEALATKSLRDLMHEVTVIVIAHRLNTIKDLDKIIFIESGEVSGEGSFSELRSHNDKFAQLIESAGI